ncbi:MAG: radical SAM protein [Candidatus Hinthialibacter sp.]
MMIRKPRLRYLIYYITSRCNMRCEHCFYLDELNQRGEMSLEEIERLAGSLGNLAFLRVTGGEPFLRKDLPEALQAFYRRAHTRRMGIITNGSRPEWIGRAVDRLLELCPDLTLDVGVSIDGLEEEHDSIRRVKGAYARAKETVETLTACKERHAHLLTSIVMTVTARNENQLDALFNETSSWGVDRLSVNHVRGKVHDPSLLQVSEKRYREFAERCERYHLEHDRSWRAGLQRAKNRLARRAIEQVTEGRLSDIACLAGSAIGVLYSDGETALCEMLEEDLPARNGAEGGTPMLGNIRNVDYDFYRIWHSPQAERCRRWVKATNCSCTHECFLTASILFGAANYPRLAQEWLRAAAFSQEKK